ncbi:MAG: ABC transporter substrate-binding protein [Dermatophilaceae bacterium]
MWHDGQPVTSADVAFTVGLLQDAAFDGAPELARLWQALTLAVVNDQTFTVTLPEPFAPFLDYTTFGLLPAAPAGHGAGGAVGRGRLQPRRRWGRGRSGLWR